METELRFESKSELVKFDMVSRAFEGHPHVKDKLKCAYRFWKAKDLLCLIKFLWFMYFLSVTCVSGSNQIRFAWNAPAHALYPSRVVFEFTGRLK